MESLTKSFIAPNHSASLLLLNPVVEFDRAFSLWVHAHAAPWLDELLQTITDGGAWRTLLVISLAVSGWLFLCQHKRAALLPLLAFSFSYLVNPLLKRTFQRARPMLWEVLDRPSDFSFPSGHAMSSIMVYGTVAMVLTQLYPRQRWFFWGTTAGLIFLIGFSRIYLGVHWLSDVLAGWATGFAFVYALSRWQKSSNRNEPTAHSPLK